MISFHPAKLGVQQVHIDLPITLTEADYSYGKASVTGHAGCLGCVFRDDLSGITPA